ncbi:MAG: LacI family DNA-binding transcriptional regulator [Pseudomonadota bacterium]
MKSTSKATISDVAELAGVSIKTVSRVVNREPNVRPATQVKVEDAIRRLHYRPNLSARNLASTRARVVVLVYDDPAEYEAPSSGFIIKMQQGALAACKQSGYDLLIHPCHYRNPNAEQELRDVIDRTRPSGVILAAPLSNMPKLVDAIRDTGVPFVPLAQGLEDSSEFTVATNDRAFSAEMTRYLASLGHTRIGFVRGNPVHVAVSKRFLGYQDGLADCGLPFDKALVVQGDNSIGSGERCGGELLQLAEPPTAIFAANDDMAAGILREAARRGVPVPEQLSVAGCDDISLAQQIYPSLTTVRQPLFEMAEAAAHVLTRGKEQSGILTVPAELKIRESTGPAPN